MEKTHITTTIKIETKQRIDNLKFHPRQSFDEILNHIVGCYETLEKEK